MNITKTAGGVKRCQ